MKILGFTFERKFIYLLSYQQDGKWKDKEFATQEMARSTIDRFKRNGVEFAFTRSRKTYPLENLLGTKIIWFGKEFHAASVLLVLLSMILFLKIGSHYYYDR